jgi:four helix bundle protein
MSVRVQSFRQLRVWQRAIELAVESYRITKLLPPDERFGLSIQIRRSASSVAANIAEGHGRTHRGDYAHHLSIARGSVTELETHFELASRLLYVSAPELTRALDLCDATSRMLTQLKRALATERTRRA